MSENNVVFNKTKRGLDLAGGILAILFGVLMLLDKVLMVKLIADINNSDSMYIVNAASTIISCIMGGAFALVFIILGAKTLKAPTYTVLGGKRVWNNHNGVNMALAIMGLISTAASIIMLLASKASSSLIMNPTALIVSIIISGLAMAIIKLIARKKPDEIAGQNPSPEGATSAVGEPNLVGGNVSPETTADELGLTMFKTEIKELKSMYSAGAMTEDQFETYVKKSVNDSLVKLNIPLGTKIELVRNLKNEGLITESLFNQIIQRLTA